MKDNKIYSRDTALRDWLIEHTWCDVCGKADLGLTELIEYKRKGTLYIEGKCKICGNPVTSEISEKRLQI